jgi:hypothetical protein
MFLTFQVIGSLPKEQQEVAKITEQNRQLVTALGRLRDAALAEKQKNEALIQRQAAEVEEVKKRASDSAAASKELIKVLLSCGPSSLLFSLYSRLSKILKI